MYGEAKVGFAAASDYDLVRTLHAEFRREATEVLELATSGRASEAKAAMADDTPFSRASSSLVGTLSRLREMAA